MFASWHVPSHVFASLPTLPFAPLRPSLRTRAGAGGGASAELAPPQRRGEDREALGPRGAPLRAGGAGEPSGAAVTRAVGGCWGGLC